MNKTFEGKSKVVTIRDYYQKLRRRDKGEFLKFLVSEFGLGYTTMSTKLNGGAKITKTDAVLLSQAIERESEWKQ